MWPEGVKATVHLRVQDGVDGMQCPVWHYEPVEAEGVLVAPSGTSDMGASRPEGTVSSLTLRMPASWSGPLAGATVDLPKPWGEGWHVVGDPQPLDPALLHGCPFNVTAEVTRANG